MTLPKSMRSLRKPLADSTDDSNIPPVRTWRKKKPKVAIADPLKPPPSKIRKQTVADVFTSSLVANDPPELPKMPSPPAADREALRRGSHPTPTPSRTRRVSKTRLRFLDLATRPKKLPVLDINLPRLTPALDNIVNPMAAREKKAAAAALALRQLILDPPDTKRTPPADSHHTTPTKVQKGGKGGPIPAIARATISLGILLQGKTDDREELDEQPVKAKEAKSKDGKGKAHKGSRLRGREMDRLRTQLLHPSAANLVIQTARSLPIDPSNAGIEPTRAVCLDLRETEAEGLIDQAKRIEHARRDQEKYVANHRFSTLKAAPAAPPRLPVLLSLFAGMSNSASVSSLTSVLLKTEQDPMPFGLFQPASALSLHRPLAGALPSVDTLKKGFDALLNAESRIYQFEGPDHQNIHPPEDRISVFTYWWGFELALPPPTLEYLAHCKSMTTSILNLLSVIVYAVPGGTRELAPFVGVLSRFIETEWVMLKTQDRGRGVVCGATWFLPAAIVARPWDFGLSHKERDKLVKFDPSKV